jgi:Ala-tRNA(Pro) deacylase
MAIAARTQAYLHAQGIPYQLLTHPRACSAGATAQAAHVPPDHIAKAVILKDDQAFLMVIVPGSYWLKLEAIGQQLGRDLVLAEEAEMASLFSDCEAGSVPPVAEPYGLEAVLDEALTTLANVYLEVGDHELLAHLSGDAFLQLTRGLRRGHFSHPG